MRACVRVWNTSINTLISQYKQTRVHTHNSLAYAKEIEMCRNFLQLFDSKHLTKSSFHWTLNTYKANTQLSLQYFALFRSICVCCQSLNVIWFFWVNRTFFLSEWMEHTWATYCFIFVVALLFFDGKLSFSCRSRRRLHFFVIARFEWIQTPCGRVCVSFKLKTLYQRKRNVLAFLIDSRVVLFRIAISVCSLCELSTELVACFRSYTLCVTFSFTLHEHTMQRNALKMSVRIRLLFGKLCKYLKWFARQVQNKSSTNRFPHVATSDKRQAATVPLYEY